MFGHLSRCHCWFLVAVAILHLWSSTSSKENVPGCDFLDEYQIVNCYLIGSDSLDVLYDALQVTSDWSEASLLVSFSRISDFPDDVFQDADLKSLSLEYNSTMAGIQSGMLRSVTSSLIRLQFSEVVGVTSIAETDFRDLPFATHLQVLIFQIPNLAEVGGAPFQWFTGLQQLTVTGTSLTSVPQDFLQGLTNLQELTLTSNPISSLPKNFFAQQSNMRTVWLGDNGLQFLEEGALDGLTDVEMFSVPGNPFNCSCSLQWFKDWLTDRQLLDASGATCQYPYAAAFSEINFCGN